MPNDRPDISEFQSISSSDSRHSRNIPMHLSSRVVVNDTITTGIITHGSNQKQTRYINNCRNSNDGRKSFRQEMQTKNDKENIPTNKISIQSSKGNTENSINRISNSKYIIRNRSKNQISKPLKRCRHDNRIHDSGIFGHECQESHELVEIYKRSFLQTKKEKESSPSSNRKDETPSGRRNPVIPTMELLNHSSDLFDSSSFQFLPVTDSDE